MQPSNPQGGFGRSRQHNAETLCAAQSRCSLRRIICDWGSPFVYSPGAGNEALFELPAPETVEPQGDSCTLDGTVTGFLEQHGAEIVDRTLNIGGGVGQVALGASICTGGVTCTGGAVLAAHGASNIWEGATGTSSLLREGYHAALGSAGDLAYSVANIGTSAYGLTRAVVKPGAWRLFHNISSDYAPAFKTMTDTELVAEGAGLINDGLNAAGVSLRQCRRP